MMVSFVLSFFPRDVLDEILNLLSRFLRIFLPTLEYVGNVLLQYMGKNSQFYQISTSVYSLVVEYSFLFISAASQPDYPMPSRVNQYPDPVAKRNSRRKEREKNHDVGHVNPAYNRHGSETDSNSSDMDNRDISPPRVRRARGGHENMAFSSDSSYEDSSSVEEDKVPGSYSVEDETFDKNRRRSFKNATKEQDILDGRRTDRRERSSGRYTRTGDQERRSRRDDFKPRNPRSDSPLTIETLEKHEKITRRESDRKPDTSKKDKSRRREPSPSVDSSATQTGSLVTEGTDFTTTTISSVPRFDKNPNLRRSSPSRSSSHRRYKKDSTKTVRVVPDIIAHTVGNEGHTVGRVEIGQGHLVVHEADDHIQAVEAADRKPNK